jgi:KTSC domain
MRRVQSSSIAAAGYDRAQEILRIRYVGGPAYDYLAVPPNVFEDFLAAESKGRFVNWQIKPYYRFMPVADGD